LKKISEIVIIFLNSNFSFDITYLASTQVILYLLRGILYKINANMWNFKTGQLICN